MYFFVQVRKKMKSLFLYLFFYLSGAMLIILLFAGIYSYFIQSNVYQISFEIFWSIEDTIPEEIKFWAWSEKIANNLFSIIIVGTVLAKFLEDMNPIYFSKYITYDTVNKKYSFRYWIMLPRRKYLYDVKMKLLLTEYETHQRGVNKLETTWQMDESKVRYDQIRGIRYVELTKKESKEMTKAMEDMHRKHLCGDKYVGGDYTIDFAIRGTAENGTNYYGWHRYKKEDILIGYRHVPLQRHEYESEDFYSEKYLSKKEREKINPSEDFYRSEKKEFFRFQHFDKVYKLTDGVQIEDKEKALDVLTKEQIIHGQYKGVKQFILDFESYITWFFIDTDRKISEVLGKMGKYILHVTHLKRFN